MRTLTVGDAQIHRVEEMAIKTPLAMFQADDALIERNADWMFPDFADADGHWDMVFQSWIVVVDGKVVVVDPCTGNGRSFPSIPMFDKLETPFLERFEASGIRPDEVDQVFCTHLHCDHSGWNTRLREGRYLPTFPNARYVIVKREYDRLKQDYEHPRPGEAAGSFRFEHDSQVFENNVRPVLEAGLVDLVGDAHSLSASLLVEPAHGHTAGHSILHLDSGGKRACFTGDAFHHPLEIVHPELDGGACDDFTATLATRRRIIAQLIDTGALMIPAHFPAPYLGHVREREGRAKFEPLR